MVLGSSRGGGLGEEVSGGEVLGKEVSGRSSWGGGLREEVWGLGEEVSGLNLESVYAAFDTLVCTECVLCMCSTVRF